MTINPSRNPDWDATIQAESRSCESIPSSPGVVAPHTNGSKFESGSSLLQLAIEAIINIQMAGKQNQVVLIMNKMQ
jgi:hypothetical protein